MCSNAQGHYGSNNSLSPAAQAVVDAYEESWDGHYVDGEWVPAHGRQLAAALRAGVEQVLPEEPLYGGDQRWTFERDARQERRKKFLALIAELENTDA